MAYLDVSAWSPEHVVGWLRGLHSSLEACQMCPLIKGRVNGKRLLLFSGQELVELLPPINVEAMEAISQGLGQLRSLMHQSKSETLQTLTLNLACQARYLCNQIIQAEHSPRLLPVSTTLTTTPMSGASKTRFDFAAVDSNMQINQSTKQRVSLETLDIVALIVDQIMRLVNWINSTGLSSNLSKFNKDFRSIILRVAVELTSTAQRDQFVEQPNDILKKTSKFLADYCEWVVLAIDDPDFIQPCWLDVVSVKRKPDENDFGIGIHSAIISSLTIEEVKFSSPAHRSGRISAGDEIVQVDYQTVIGWPPDKVNELIKGYTSEIILTIKKKPTQTLNPSIVIMRPYAIPLKKILSHQSESLSIQDGLTVNQHGVLERQSSFVEHIDSSSENEELEPPKEPKGPVYPELQITRSKRELKRRMSISGDISDALVDLSLADALPIPTLERTPPSTENIQDKSSKPGKITKEALTKSVSHDTAKLYLHTLSIDRKHLWLPKSPKLD